MKELQLKLEKAASERLQEKLLEECFWDINGNEVNLKNELVGFAYDQMADMQNEFHFYKNNNEAIRKLLWCKNDESVVQKLEDLLKSLIPKNPCNCTASDNDETGKCKICSRQKLVYFPGAVGQTGT